MDSELRIKMRQTSAVIYKAVQDELSKSQFLLGTHNDKRLRGALSNVNKLHLANTVLLNPSIHEAHAEDLARRFIQHWENLKQKHIENFSIIPMASRPSRAPKDADIAGVALRFFTLVDSVVFADHSEAVKAAKRMQMELITSVRRVKGISCLGAVELEVISLKHMCRLRELGDTDQVEQRKLEVCETLAAQHCGPLFESESSYMLVHFHGVLSADKESKFESLERELKTNPRWNAAPRQIEIKKLSAEFGGKPKSVSQNLTHIARYITKGGNDWYGGKAYLRYKISFNNDMALSQDEWEALNWRRNELLRLEHMSEGITDMLSLTHGEIATLAESIDSLMALNKTRTGYLISVGKWENSLLQPVVKHVECPND